MPIARELAAQLLAAARRFGAVVLSGPRRSGKTYLLRRTFPKASYHLLEDPDVLARVKADPRGWLDDVETPAILDEIQNAPELFAYIRSRVDGAPRKKGAWILTGSQEFALMDGVAESMAGRAGVFQLWPLSFREVQSWSLLRGGYPEATLRPRTASVWFASYVQTYLERDLRALRVVKDLSTFRRFLALLAARTGQLLNRTDLAAPLGVSVPTVSDWVSILETTGIVMLVPPYFENFGKRLVKSPKVYFTDAGLACHLLGLTTLAQVDASPFAGPLFEGFIASEIVKNQLNSGARRELYHFRDEQGLEVDFVVPRPGSVLELVEAKWSRTLKPEMAGPLHRLARVVSSPTTRSVVVHRAARTEPPMRTLDAGVEAMSVEEYLTNGVRMPVARKRERSR